MRRDKEHGAVYAQQMGYLPKHPDCSECRRIAADAEYQDTVSTQRKGGK